MTLYRVLEMVPGGLSLLTLFLIVILSWQFPVFVAIFIIAFDTYWLFKTIFLSLHLRSSFKTMREYENTSWLEKLKTLGEVRGVSFLDIKHLIIFPMYKESYEIVRGTFENLKSSNYPKEKFIVVLGIEERAGKEAEETAEKIKAEFDTSFGDFLITKHPSSISGEIQGKGSNETWAAKEAQRLVIDPKKVPYERTLVSVFDIDTSLKEEYFGCLTYHFLTAEHKDRSSYQPIPLFLNNIYEAPAFARVIAFSATFWHMIQQSRPERLTTFSSHSMPFKALHEVGFWETNVVSEDSRIFWQCFMHYNGDWRVVPLFYPVSMDANVAPTFWQTLVNQYKQQRRWGYGAENVPYILYNFIRNKKIRSRIKWQWGFNVIESFHSWATNSLIIFSLGWLPIMIGGSKFHSTVLSYNLPQITGFIMTLASVGIVSSALLSILLLPTHKEMRVWHYPLYVLHWFLMPITLIVFGAFPALDAQIRLLLGQRFKLGFWITPKFREVSGKTV